jgi:mono/diheme cytochrome c family protein
MSVLSCLARVRCASLSFAGLLLAMGALPVAAQDSAGAGGSGTKTGQSGEQIYRQICQACHMPDARGASGAAVIPALARNPKLADASYPITMVLKGRGVMPWFAGSLKPAQIAAVVGYVRTHFGNDYPEPVTEADVIALSVNLPVPSD